MFSTILNIWGFETALPNAGRYAKSSVRRVYYTNEGDGDRTRNLRIDNPMLINRNHLKFKHLQTMAPIRGTNKGQTDPELGRLAAIWPSLPGPIRKALLGMAEAAGGKANRR